MEKIIISLIVITALVVVAGILIYSNLKLRKEHKHSELLTDQLITTLVSAIDAKDPYTQGHSIRVAMYSRELARRAGKSTEFQKNIYYLGMVHDVGKIGVPGSILRKTEKLTPEEYAKVREHPTMGGEILDGVTEIPRIRIGALYHHEHYDGGGYPFGMIGESIPEEARIIAVADAYDAMASNRSYRTAMPQEDIRKIITDSAGSQLDPKYAQLMIDMIDDDKDYIMRGQAVASKDSINMIRDFLAGKWK
ncbi:MAG: HD-GYP domain-containing protein [Lachnospiraceae bacterium]|nr:HD-GYP domain-containing protein [Lachnospiraceae bacterium]